MTDPDISLIWTLSVLQGLGLFSLKSLSKEERDIANEMRNGREAEQAATRDKDVTK